MSLLGLHYLSHLRKTQWLRPDDLERLQWEKLHRVLRHAYENVPYYRRLFDHARLRPTDIRSDKDLEQIPITTKEALQEAPFEDLLARGVTLAQCIERKTSGTTGRPLRILLTRREKETQDLVQARAMLENGMKLTDTRAVFVAPWQVPRQPYWFQRLGIWRKIYFSVFDDIREQFPVLERVQPDCLAGTPAILKLIALEKVRRGSTVLKPGTIFSTADLLDRGTRQLIESVFEVPVVDLYGSLEFGYMAWECSEHQGYHLNMESVVMEFLQGGHRVSNGESGEVVCTSLHSYAMPLIRYRLGDLCVPTDARCPCGRGLPLITLIAGRANDTVKLPGGRVVTPQALADVMVEFAGMIQQFRIIQEGETDIAVQLVKGRDFHEGTVGLVEGSLRKMLGEEIAFHGQIVDAIEREPSGKQRAIISRVTSH